MANLSKEIQDPKQTLKNLKYTDVNQIIALLLHENILFDKEYFSIFTENIKKIEKLSSTEEGSVKSILVQKLDDLKMTLSNKQDSPDLMATSTILDIILYPLKTDINKKNYDTFNIDIDFFRDIKNKNENSYYNLNYDDMISVTSYKFDKNNKLKSFVLKKLSSGVQYEYNSKYECITMIFDDGTKMKMNEKKNAKKTNKSS